MRRASSVVGAAAAVAAALVTGAVRAQGPAADGAALFATHCASCHEGTADSRAPRRDALALRTPDAIVLALTNGVMRLQGSRIGGVERRAIAEYLTGRPIGNDVAGAATGTCTTPATFGVPASGPQWSGWGPTSRNTRFQSANIARLTAAETPKLTLKWALGYPDATHAWALPVVTSGWMFVGSQNGTVYALDASSGCIRWTFSAAGGVRTAVSIGTWRDGGYAIYFGDTNATVYALDAQSGRELWHTKVDQHPLGRVTGAPTLHDGHLYVPVSSYEEVDTASPLYPCCTFRGSLSALDAQTGRIIWTTYTSDEPKPRGMSSAGIPLFGPSGAGIWTSPTVDSTRGVVYASTGNDYSEPASGMSDAVVAFDMKTGAVRWVRQVTAGDVYIGGCRPGVENANCPSALGPDFDFGNPPILATRPDGRDVIVIGQKSGIGYALDPDAQGRIVWQYRAGQGGALGGMEYGSAVDDTRAYFPVSDMNLASPGGLHAVSLMTGERVWMAPPPPPVCGTGRGCSAAQAAAVTVIPGVVFSGSNDGALRAYSTTDGSILWTFDTNREFTTINGVEARGASILGPGPVVADGMVFVNSGYGSHGGRAGNVLLAFGVDR